MGRNGRSRRRLALDFPLKRGLHLLAADLARPVLLGVRLLRHHPDAGDVGAAAGARGEQALAEGLRQPLPVEHPARQQHRI